MSDFSQRSERLQRRQQPVLLRMVEQLFLEKVVKGTPRIFNRGLALHALLFSGQIADELNEFFGQEE